PVALAAFPLTELLAESVSVPTNTASPPPRVTAVDPANEVSAMLFETPELVNMVVTAPPEYIPPPNAPTPFKPDAAVFPLIVVFVMLSEPLPAPIVIPPPRAAVPATADPALLPEIVEFVILTVELAGPSNATPPPL